MSKHKFADRTRVDTHAGLLQPSVNETCTILATFKFLAAHDTVFAPKEHHLVTAATEGVTPQYIKQDILPDIFKAFWVRRRALDRRNYSQVVETLALARLAQKAGTSYVLSSCFSAMGMSDLFPSMAFACIPAILNEYRTRRAECSHWWFEGAVSAHYVDSVVSMLEDALTDHDLVDIQTANTVVKHLALGVAGRGSMLHLVNLEWRNCFEMSPHVIGAVTDAIDAMRVTLHPGNLLSYVLQGMLHTARKVREAYWRVYNALYLGAEDALVPFYTKLPELGERQNVYDRHPLQVYI
ncbi:hypothetical protein BV25DRAFT_1911963 [Artomyces pyxidatus]|uniref:Uncharacterized protein n=1 Tax=Artomyces pyxidatus TaxID=48021 RepID=A0ACB8TFY3_9AGAM|nr:hypothetical protein BV25DRAFT_1911963 [Artomyces pyxidatus]